MKRSRSRSSLPVSGPSTPPSRKLCLSLRKKPRQDKVKEPANRFSFVSDEEASTASKGVVPVNTESTNKWALKNLEEWMEIRSVSNEPVPCDLLSCSDASLVCKWLCRFVQETRKIDGSRYPSSSIRSLLAAFQRIMHANKLPYRLFDLSDTRFLNLRNTLDTVSVSLRKEVIGANKTHAAVISSEDQKLMWESGVLGTDSPWTLVRAVFVITGLHFSLRGGQEHRDLSVDQFKRFPDDSCYDANTYYEQEPIESNDKGACNCVLRNVYGEIQTWRPILFLVSLHIAMYG